MPEAFLQPDNFQQVVLIEDNHLLGVIKPPGLLVQGDDTNRPCLLNLAKEYLKLKYNKPGQVFLGLVHRLDRLVGGVLVLSRTSKAAGRLSAQFREHRVRKIYWAVVEGRLDPPEGFSEMHLVRKGIKSILSSTDDPQARPARLIYRTLETSPLASLIEVDLLTGRRHQIRAQLSALGCPIAGDRLYGSSMAAGSESIGLWARQLTVTHPTKGHPVTIQAGPDLDWPWLPLV